MDLYADGRVLRGDVVGAGGTVPVEVDISRFQALEVRVITLPGCIGAAAPRVYFGDAMVV